MTPAKSWFGKEGFLQVAKGALREFQQQADNPDVDEHALITPLNKLALARREALSPARRIENALHPWVAFGIMPLFALANAGVNIQGISMGAPVAVTVLLGIVLGLAVGKVVGIVGMSWLAIRLRFSALPPGVTWKGLIVLGFAGGIGFTMAIFISELAFADPALLGMAKVAVLVGTAVAGTAALVTGVILLPKKQPTHVADITASELEASAAYWTLDGLERPTTRDGIRARM